MKNKMNAMNEKFSALSGREKGLIIILAWAALIYLMYTMMIEPTTQSIQKFESKIASEQSKIQQNQLKLAQVTMKLNEDPNEKLDVQIAALEEESDRLAAEMDELMDSLVSPSDMANLLEQVLNESHKLKLVSLESLPIESIQVATEDPNVFQDLGYYVHPVKIALTGRYFDIQEYLAALEQMPVKYYWRSFNYQVDEYPTAKLELVVYTFGGKQEFIGG